MRARLLNQLDQSCRSSIVLNVFQLFQLSYRARPAGRRPVPGSPAPYPTSGTRHLSGLVGTFVFSLYNLSQWPSLHRTFLGTSVFGFLLGAWPVLSSLGLCPCAFLFVDSPTSTPSACGTKGTSPTRMASLRSPVFLAFVVTARGMSPFSNLGRIITGRLPVPVPPACPLPSLLCFLCAVAVLFSACWFPGAGQAFLVLVPP